jgi:hypothetical protein
MMTLRLLRGWLCFHLVLLLPIALTSPAYRWLLGWGGWYAHGADDVPVNPTQEKNHG